MLAPFPRNPTWSSLAYKASAVASGSKGAFVSSLRLCKRLTNVSLATGDMHARTHTCHRWPVCYCYPVVKELRTQRRCAGRFSKQKGPDACAIRALGHSTEAALMR